MVKPVKPTAPAPALRSNPDTFSVNAEGTITYMFTTFPDYTDAVADFVDAQADAALAAALGGDLPPLTGNALEFLRVNAGETAGEFYSFVTAMDDNRPVATQLEAETGTATGVYMDPLRTAQAIVAQRPSYVTNMAGVSRLVNTTYTNTSGRDMHIFIVTTYTGTNTTAALFVNGVELQRFGIGNGLAGLLFSFAGLVPAGLTYSLNVLTGTATIAGWRESEY